DRCPEFALQFTNRHLGERLAPMRSRHHTVQLVPDPLELLPQAQCQQDLDAVGPQDNPRAGRAELALPLVVFDLEAGPLAHQVSRQTADASPDDDDLHSADPSPPPPHTTLTYRGCGGDVDLGSAVMRSLSNAALGMAQPPQPRAPRTHREEGKASKIGLLPAG